MTPRPICLRDILPVVLLAERECYRFGPVVKWIYDWLGEGFARATLIEVNGRVAGFSVCMAVSAEPWWECRLAAVEPEFQRRGVARALFVADQAAALDAGVDILLTVALDNAPMRGLAADLGYERVEVAPLTFPDGTEAALMRWRHRTRSV